MPETAALQKPMTGFHLKLIALTTMFIDHIGAVFFPQVTLLRVIGRISFPLYAFLIAEGCRYTRNRGRYALGLGAFALISELPYDLALHPEFLEYGLWGQNFLFQTNIFYTMFFAVAGLEGAAGRPGQLCGRLPPVRPPVQCRALRPWRYVAPLCLTSGSPVLPPAPALGLLYAGEAVLRRREAEHPV